MSKRVTKKWVLKNYKHVIFVPYCTMNELLNAGAVLIGHTERIGGVGSRVYECDYFDGEKVAIVTGYQKFGIIADTNYAKSNNERFKKLKLNEEFAKIELMNFIFSTLNREV